MATCAELVTVGVMIILCGGGLSKCVVPWLRCAVHCDRQTALGEPRAHRRHLTLLLPVDVVAKVHQSLESTDLLVVSALELLHEQCTHVNRAFMVRNHATHKVDTRVAHEVNRHLLVHTCVDRVPTGPCRRAAIATADHLMTHRHVAATAATTTMAAAIRAAIDGTGWASGLLCRGR